MLRERRHHSFTLWRSQLGCRTDSRLQILVDQCVTQIDRGSFMSPLAQKRTSEHVQSMSALPLKADIAERHRHVTFLGSDV